MESMAAKPNSAGLFTNGGASGHFQMPVHYPRYSKPDYEAMPEWKLDSLLAQYGLPVAGDLADKRGFAIGAFLWTPSSVAGTGRQ